MSMGGASAAALGGCGFAAAELQQALEAVDCKVKSSEEAGSIDGASGLS